MAVVESTNAMMTEAGTVANPVKTDKKQANKDLQKTKLCVYYLKGECGYGANCTFAHSPLEVKSVPDLTKTQLCVKFAEGKCTDENCTYAHGEAELRDPPNFKKKLCKWHSKGRCRNGVNCGFAHDIKELRMVTPSTFDVPNPQKIAAPPGLTKMDDCDASTDVPSSSLSQTGTDLSMAGNPSIPEEHLFRFMAGRGSAPLQKQVALMGSAIGGLQAKLAQLEDMMLQTQVSQMQQSIQQLSEQCWALENGISMAQQPMLPAEPTSLKSRLNAKAVPFRPWTGDKSDDTASVGSD